jgi:alkylation response protein AidB-like acyl-CoA dehydrogenase
MRILPKGEAPMDFALTSEQEALKKEFGEFFKEEMKSAPAALGFGARDASMTEEGWKFHRQMAEKLGEKGWISRAWPKEYGGQDAPIIEQVIFNEVRANYGAPGIDQFGVGMLAPTLLVAGSEDQKKRFLPSIARGETMWCQGWSEPNAGSDLASLTTKAARQGDNYIINGQKIWTSNAHRADWMFMLARTDPNEKRSKGISFFLLDMKAPGVTVRGIENMDKSHSYNEVLFEDVKVPVENRVGEENKGWTVTRQTMNFERSGIDRFVEIRKIIELLVQYAKETKRDGKPIAEDPIIRQKLAQLAVDNEAGQALAYRIAWEQSKGGLIMAAYMASMAKVFGSELYQRFAYIGCEIMGMHSQIQDEKWAPLRGKFIHYYQLCCGGNIAAGSSEVQRNLIAWVGLGLPRTI